MSNGPEHYRRGEQALQLAWNFTQTAVDHAHASANTEVGRTYAMIAAAEFTAARASEGYFPTDRAEEDEFEAQWREVLGLPIKRPVEDVNGD